MKNDLTNELGTNFIEYAVAVNTDRAIPDAKSGLKPVARRILWAAYEGGYTSAKKHMKNATIVGDVIGHYHPHGDSSVYGAETRLSQDWVMRYPLIDWHGNNGNIAGDGAAHYRYTEGRLAKLSEEGLLAGLKKRNVDFIPNFAEDKEEPVTLPAIFPNLLCNPNTGIGVAMACNWLPHNLKEVAQAIYDYMDGKEPFIPGPDFPTGGLIINEKEVPNFIKTGHGSVKVRGKYKVESRNIVFYEIPYGTTIEALMTEIGDASDKKEIEGIDDIRDESNKKGLRIVIECERGIEPETVVKKLFSKTNLQTSISYNQVALIDKTPTELGLKDCIKIYVEHNEECIRKEATFDLAKAEAKLNIVEGLLIALEDIDNIIAKIKASESAAAAKETLMKDYKLNEEQAKAVLDMKLAKLAKLEKVEVNNDKNALIESIKSLKNILENKSVQQQMVRDRLQYIVKKYGDDRRTEMTTIEVTPEYKEVEEVVPEDCVVVMSQSGDVKRIAKSSFRTQRRAGKGIKSEDDAILDTINTNTIDNLMIFTNEGKMYKVLVDKLPVGTNASKGQNINNLINLAPSEKVIAISSLNRETDAEYVVFITKNGLIKKTKLEEYKNIKKGTGIAAIKLNEGDSIANVTFLKDEDIIIVTKDGMSIHFPTKDINSVGRVAAGVKSIKLGEGDIVVAGLPIHKDTDMVAIITEKGYGKKVKISEFPIQARAGKGVQITKLEPTVTGDIIGAAMVDDEDAILLVGKPNSICVAATDLPLLGRTAIGNTMIKASTVLRVTKI